MTYPYFTRAIGVLIITACFSCNSENHSGSSSLQDDVKKQKETPEEILYRLVREERWDEIQKAIRQPGFDPNIKLKFWGRENEGYSLEPLFKVLVRSSQFDLALEIAKVPGFRVTERGNFYNLYGGESIFFQDKIITRDNPPPILLPHTLDLFLKAVFTQSGPARMGEKEKSLFDIVMKDKLTDDFDPTHLSDITDPVVMRRFLDTKPNLKREDRWGSPVSESTRRWLTATINQYQSLNGIVGTINEREKKIEGLNESLRLLNAYAPENQK